MPVTPIPAVARSPREVMEFSEAEIRRYARHIVLPEIGGRGQALLRSASVAVVGAGGLGSPLLLYLAAAGIGELRVIDDDVVEISNLQRQVLYGDEDVGAAKLDGAVARLRSLNPDARVVALAERLDGANAERLIGDAGIVADGSDSFATRAVVQDACMRLGRVLVSASVQGFDGQVSTFKAHLGAPHPCLRCVFPDAPDADSLPSCARAGVLGPAAGVVGSLQAVEVIKEILGEGDSLSGTLVLYDALATRLDRVRIARRRACVGSCERLTTQ